MAVTRAPQGVQAIPADANTGRFWAGGRTRRIVTESYAFPAATTTPFSGNAPAGVIVYDQALAWNANPAGTAYGETDASDATGLEIIVSNADSGQTLSGITLQDYDTLPSGVTVPGQSYTTATNVATGASVTLASLALASGDAVRLWIPVQSTARMFVLNPTYAAAVTVGTGSLEIRVTPTYGQVSLTGRFAPSSPTVIAHGTTTVGVGVSSVNTLEITTEATFQHIVVAIYNNSGESIPSIYAVSDSADIDTYSGASLVDGLTIPQGSSITNGSASVALLDASASPYLFLFGEAHITFNLSAATTAAGSISWSLIGY